MRSVIDARHEVPNTKRRFGEAATYIPVRVFDASGWRDALLTHDQLIEAVRRAERNSEDVPPLTRRERVMRATHQAAGTALEWLRRLWPW